MGGFSLPSLPSLESASHVSINPHLDVTGPGGTGGGGGGISTGGGGAPCLFNCGGSSSGSYLDNLKNFFPNYLGNVASSAVQTATSSLLGFIDWGRVAAFILGILLIIFGLASLILRKAPVEIVRGAVKSGAESLAA